MKPSDHSSISRRAATNLRAVPVSLIVLAAAVVAAAFCAHYFPSFTHLAKPFAQAGIVVFIAARLLAAVRKKALQQERRPVRVSSIRRRD
jgi:hypothetical protein